MGIPSYFSHIVKKHRAIIKSFIQHKDKINNLYLDSNSIIYDAVHELPKDTTHSHIESILILAVCDKIIHYINLLKPNQTVLIAFDGVAPVAKLNQQRRRRYATGAISTTQPANLLPGGKGAEPPWNTANITPGTSFMSLLGDKVKARFANPKEFGLLNLIVSAADEVGEGEHKLFEHIRQFPTQHKESTTVIYGLDADLIMLTLNHLHISDKLYLFRETPHFIKSLDNTLDPNSLYLLDIPLLSKNIEVPVQDYIFICFLLGNDFMPHFPALNIRTKGIDHLMLAYKHVFADSNGHHLIDQLTNGSKIIWKNVRKYITYLASLEVEYLQAEYSLRDKMAKRKPFQTEKDVDETLLLPMKDRSPEVYINPFEAGWRERYYSTLFDIKINDARCKEICINYLEGLEWTMKYYTSGCVDWRWTYKYHYPPLLADLIKYIPYFDTNLLTLKEKNPVLPLVQLCYVLPKSSHYLLPQKVNALISKAKPEWYSSNCRFHWAFCKYFWESHIDMPEINIGELELLVLGQ